MFSHETARGTVGLTPNKYTYMFTCTLYSVLFEPRKTFLSRSGWLTYPSHIMPVQAFSIFIVSCLPERNIDVRIDQLLYKKYDLIALNHSNISPLCLVWVRAPLWAHVRQAKFCLRLCQVVFSRGSPVFAPPTNWPVSYELK